MDTLEVMKMAHMQAAPISGSAKALKAVLGKQVSANRIVLENETEKEAV